MPIAHCSPFIESPTDPASASVSASDQGRLLRNKGRLVTNKSSVTKPMSCSQMSQPSRCGVPAIDAQSTYVRIVQCLNRA